MTFEVDDFRRSVMPTVRRSAKRAVEGGWKAGSGGAFIHTETGHWGQVAFRVANSIPLSLTLTAGVLSPFLMRVVDRLDPDRNPPAALIAAHAQTEWFQPIHFDANHTGPATSPDPAVVDPTADFVGQTAAAVTLGPESAPEWFEQRTRHLIQKTSPLLSDLALRDWLLTTPGLRHIRYAILLSRHLGLDDEIPALLKRDAEQFEWLRKESPVEPEDQAYFDRRRHYHCMWSPERFLRWLETTDLS